MFFGTSLNYLENWDMTWKKLQIQTWKSLMAEKSEVRFKAVEIIGELIYPYI